jgi:hypothetical protein
VKWGSWIFCIASTHNLNCEILKEQPVLQQGMTRLFSRMRAILFPYSCIPPLYAGRTICCSSSTPYATNPEWLRPSFIHSLLFNYFDPSFTHYGTDTSTTYLTHVVVSLTSEEDIPLWPRISKFYTNFYFFSFSSAIYSNFASCVGFYFNYERSLFLKGA